MKYAALLILILGTTSCSPVGTLDNDNSSGFPIDRSLISDFYAIDRSLIDVQRNSVPEGARVIVLPLQDSKGQLLIANGEGGFSLGTPTATAFEYPIISLEDLTDSQRDFLEKYRSADIVITGEFVSSGEGYKITAIAISPRTGFQMAATEILVRSQEVNSIDLPSNVFLARADIFDSQIPILSLYSTVQLYSSPDFARISFSTGPQGGWGGVFRRAFGGGETRTRTRPARLSSFPRPKADKDNLDETGDDPRDTPPPNFYGEEVDGEQICRVILQCQNALQIARTWGPSLPGLTVIADIRHCGWYTYIPDAEPKRIGFHIQPGDSLNKGRLQALTFFSDRGFKELSITYRFAPYDSQPRDNNRACKIARCIRLNSWAYGVKGDRDYQAFNQLRPNSNSFIGAIAKRCSISSRNFPSSSSDGKYPGWNYWRRTGPNVRRPDWLRVPHYPTSRSDRPRFTPFR